MPIASPAGYIGLMVVKGQSRIATKVLVGAAVLCLGAGAAHASGGAVDGAAARAAEIARLQHAWGTDVVRGGLPVDGSKAILVGTRDLALLHSSSPQRWLGSRYPVVVIYAPAPGSVRPSSEDECGTQGMMSTRDQART